MTDIFRKRGLIVSCQALPDEPLYGANMMVRMALAAQFGGAIGIRANGVSDIRAIKRKVGLPVIGLIKKKIEGSDIFITPTMREIEAIIRAGADIVALDMTDRGNRLGEAKAMTDYIHESGALVMADVSTLEEGLKAESLGVDYVSTTLSGYTPYSPQQEDPDFELVEKLAGHVRIPVIAEGRIWCPEDAVRAMEAGAEHVVVGSAITRPHLITRKYVDKMTGWLNIEKLQQNKSRS
jgi:N-acylglucosamine-6-phosphate 2-epimerase